MTHCLHLHMVCTLWETFRFNSCPVIWGVDSASSPFQIAKIIDGQVIDYFGNQMPKLEILARPDLWIVAKQAVFILFLLSMFYL